LDFKGRRFQAQPGEAATAQEATADDIDGDRKQ
jgi:hypothetical protein